MAPSNRAWVMALLFGLILFVLASRSFSSKPYEGKAYNEFLADVQAGRVEQVRMGGNVIRATYAQGEQVQVIPLDVEYALDELRKANVPVEYVRLPGRPWWGGLVTGLLPAGLLIGYLWLMARPGAGGGQLFQFSRSRARLLGREENRITMKDVAGLPETKEELAEVIDFLRSPERYLELGARIPKGVLLEGPPGTGKTLLARAVSGEAGVPFYSISGSDFVEMFAGVGAARVRDLFERARASAPCIIFMDEIDAVGRQRGHGLGGANDEREQTLNQLLVEMDGFAAAEGIIVMAATNRIDVLDPALLRPGRFDRVVHIDPPDRGGRAEILLVHAAGKRLEPAVSLDDIAALTVGFTGADLANLLNEAALLAARRRKEAIGPAEMENAYERVVTGGAEKKRVISRQEKQRVAFHEAGHALVSRKLSHTDPIQKVSIIPRGRAAGYVLYRPEEDRRTQSRTEFLDFLTGILAGRAAEEVVLGDTSTGAANDLERATDLARRMVTQWGMAPELGPILVSGRDGASVGGVGAAPVFSERTAWTVDQAVRKLVHEGYQRAVDLLRRHRDALERVAHALLERETLSGSELEKLI